MFNVKKCLGSLYLVLCFIMSSVMLRVAMSRVIMHTVVMPSVIVTSVVKLNGIMLNAVMLNVSMLSVVAPLAQTYFCRKKKKKVKLNNSKTLKKDFVNY